MLREKGGCSHPQPRTVLRDWNQAQPDGEKLQEDDEVRKHGENERRAQRKESGETAWGTGVAAFPQRREPTRKEEERLDPEQEAT